ncbi:BppU family phage baseplate upper protein [Weissella paramesenteroides]
MSNQYLSFDVTKQSAPQQLITGRQGDNQLKFVTMLFWDGDKNVPYDLTGKQVAFEALKPDNTHVVDSEGITILDAPAGLVRYSFNEQVFSVTGTMQQAFFKITHTDSDNNVIADSTLEVAINILENRVEFGINSKDYLSEYDDLIAKVKKKFDDYAATVQDSIDKATALHDQIVEYINLINSKHVVTFDENDSSQLYSDGNKINPRTITQSISDFEPKSFEVYKKQRQNNPTLINNESFLKYKMMSITKYIDTTNEPSLYQKIANYGADTCLVPMVGVDGLNDNNLIAQSHSDIQNEIDKIKSSGSKLVMLKPHIGLNTGGDTLNRHDYAPSDVSLFFKNWKNILLDYANLAEENGTEILCIGCEQYTNITPVYEEYWKDIYNTLKSLHPNLKLTYAESIYEWLDNGRSYMINKYVDIIGLNMYPSWSTDKVGIYNKQNILNAWYSDAGGYNYQLAADNLARKFRKPVIITETGVTHFNESLNHPLNVINKSDSEINYDIAGYAMNAFFTAISQSNAIIGFAWWNMSGEFTIFDGSEKETYSEKVFKQFCKEGTLSYDAI